MVKLIRCAACSREISDQAATCPHCGQPTRPPKQPAKQVSGCAVVLLAGLGLFIYGLVKSPNVSTTPARPTVNDAECQQNLQCSGDRSSTTATRLCKAAIEAHALHSVRWTDSFANPALARADWADQSAHTLRYYGTRVEFQNGFGAMTRMVYSCDYDPVSRKVLAVDVREYGQ